MVGRKKIGRFTVWARIQDWWILIPFDNRVYHLSKSVSFNAKRSRKPETNMQKRFEDMKSEFPPGSFQPGKQGMSFQTFRLFTETSKTTRFFLVCFNGSYIESCSSFMIHKRCHTSIYAPLWHPPSFFSVLRAREGKNFKKNYCTNTWSKIFNCFKETSFYKPNGIVWRWFDS